MNLQNATSYKIKEAAKKAANARQSTEALVQKTSSLPAFTKPVPASKKITKEDSKKISGKNSPSANNGDYDIRLPEKPGDHCLLNCFKAVDEVRKMLLQGSALFRKGQHKEGMQVLCRAFKLAEEKELYAEQISSFEMMMISAINSGKIPDYSGEKPARSLRMLGELSTAQVLYFQSKQPLLFGSYPAESVVHEWEMKAGLLQGFLGLYRSDRIAFYFHYHCLHIAYHRKNCQAILSHSAQLRFLIAESKIYERKEKLLCSVLVHEIAGLLAEGLKKEAMELCGKISEEHVFSHLKGDLLAMQKLFVCAIELKQLHLSEALLKASKDIPEIKETPYLKQKWNYYSGIQKFATSSYKEALDIFENCDSGSKKRSSREAFIAIMALICHKEMNRTDRLLAKSEALQKFFYRYHSEFKAEDPRFACISWIMKTLLRYDFNFGKTAQKEKQKLLLLKKGGQAYQWFPGGAELIRFDVWFKEQQVKEEKKVKRG